MSFDPYEFDRSYGSSAHGISEGEYTARTFLWMVLGLMVTFGVAALRVVGARTSVRPVMDGGALTGLSLTCTLDANMAEGNLDLRTEEVHASLETALAQVEEARIRSALELAQELDADYLGLLRRAALARPWHKEALEGASLGALELELHVTAKLQRSYDAAR